MPISAYSPVRDDNALITPGDIRIDDPKYQQIVNAIRQLMADLADSGDILNSLGVSAYIQTLLDDADEATARATLGISSSTYTPTASAAVNLASVTPAVFQYLRIGNVVTVSGAVVTDTLATGAASFELTLPIASNFAATTQCAGHGTVGTSESMRILASIANDTAAVSWTSVVTSAQTYALSFTYLIV